MVFNTQIEHWIIVTQSPNEDNKNEKWKLKIKKNSKTAKRRCESCETKENDDTECFIKPYNMKHLHTSFTEELARLNMRELHDNRMPFLFDT